MRIIKSIFDRSLLLPIFSGLLLGFSFPPFHFGWLAFVGFIPLIFAVKGAKNYREVLKLSYFGFLVLNIVAIYWVGGWTRESDPFLMIGGAALVFCHPFFFTVPMLVYHFLHKRFGELAVFLFPFLYLSFEHLHSIGEVAFPWLTIGYSQSYNQAGIQFSSFTGLFGISFQILLVNSFLYYSLTSWMDNRGAKKFRIARSLSIALLLIVIPEIYGEMVLRSAGKNEYANKLKVAIIQPNIDPNEKWNGDIDQIMETYEQETYKSGSHESDLVVWPETAIPFYILLPQFSCFKRSLESFLDSTNTSLLAGVPIARYYSDSDSAKPSSHFDESTHRYYDAYNGAAVFEPHSNVYQTYGKIILVPFGERIPYADAVPFLIKPLNWGVGISNWARGKDTTVFRLRGGPTFGTVICYESIFPNYVRAFVEKGADFLVIITNDGWYGKSSGPYQHAAYAVLRAVENRRAVVRAANTGISEFIDPYGNLIGKQTRLDERMTLEESIPISHQLTFYTMHGDWIANFAEVISAAVILFGLFLKFKSKN
ncbi:MAG TPA: apolipoprotein N-acyltransferase [Candidatus Acidoferrales bacterium]|nr:apolipoprotein N-acyltransferase [Candidatus Acidoferrales bacterium]